MFLMLVFVINTVTLDLCVCVRSYPYSEDSSQGKQYMNTRCPSWCDRILMSSSAKDLILKVRLQTLLQPPFLPPDPQTSSFLLFKTCLKQLNVYHSRF